MAFETVNSTGQQPTNQYDVQRQKVRDEEAERRKKEQEALQRRLAARGFTAGSGYTETQQRKSDIESLAGERERLTNVDLSQLAAGETASEAEKLRKWQTGERVGSQQYGTQERLGTQEYGTKERLGTQKYGTQERLGTQEYGTKERQGAQEYGTQERLGTQQYEAGQNKEERNLRQQEIDNQAIQAASKQDFDYWATEAGYTDAERNRAWQERQSTIAQNAAATENEANRQAAWDLTNLSETLARGRLSVQEAITNNSNALKTHTDYLYNLGVNGTPPGNLDKLSQLEQDAYYMGASGKTKTEYDKKAQADLDLRNQLILAVVEDEDKRKTLSEDIITIFDQFKNGELTGLTGE